MQGLDQALQVLRGDKVVIVKKQRETALGLLQRQIGGDRSVKSHRVMRVDHAKLQVRGHIAQGTVCTCCSVHHHHLDVGVSLLRHAGQRFGQAGSVHAANEHTDKGQIL